MILTILQHSAEVYHGKVLTTYPIKKYSTSLTSTTIANVQDVSFLKPKATTVEFHMYPTEHVIVLEGNNLWFCHKVHIGRDDNTIEIDSPSNIMRRSIQFNFKPSDKTEKLCENGRVHVTLYSHFADEISKRINAKKVLSTLFHKLKYLHSCYKHMHEHIYLKYNSVD